MEGPLGTPPAEPAAGWRNIADRVIETLDRGPKPRAIQKKGRGVYGSPRIRAELRHRGSGRRSTSTGRPTPLTPSRWTSPTWSTEEPEKRISSSRCCGGRTTRSGRDREGKAQVRLGSLNHRTAFAQPASESPGGTSTAAGAPPDTRGLGPVPARTPHSPPVRPYCPRTGGTDRGATPSAMGGDPSQGPTTEGAAYGGSMRDATSGPWVRTDGWSWSNSATWDAAESASIEAFRRA